jgi:small-conductance mechanosensitive channel
MKATPRVVTLLSLLAVLAGPAWGQLPKALLPKAPAPDTTPVAPAVNADTASRPFSASDIPKAADLAIARSYELSTAGAGGEAAEILDKVQALTDSIGREERVADLTRGHQLTRRGLGDLSLTWVSRDLGVRVWRLDLQELSSTVDSARSELERLAVRWNITAARQDSTTTPNLRARTLQVIDEVHRVDSVLAARSSQVVAAELALSGASSTITAELQGLAAAQAELRRDLLRRDSPPLWKSLVAGGSLASVERGGLATTLPEIGWFVRGNAGRLLIHLLLTILILLIALTGRETVRSAAESSHQLGEQYTILRRPVAATLLLSCSVLMLLYPRAPLGVYDAALLLSAIPLLLLIPELIPDNPRLPAFLAVGFLVVQRLSTVATVGHPASRLVQLFLSVAGAALLWHALQPGGSLRRTEPRWRLYLQRLAWLLFGAFVVAIVANILGNVTLADAINSGVALSAYLGILLRAVTMVVDVFASAAVRTGAKESRYLAARGQQVDDALVRIVGTIALLSWFIVSLKGFQIWEPVRDALGGALASSYTIGNVSLSLGTVLLFVLVLTIGVLAARLVSGIVEFDVMGRMDLRRGVSVTVGSLLRYLLIAAAFFMSLAAVGIDASNLAIVGGALGVGIGFGLQNIVNNFISGLVLAFERPVGVGDMVQVGSNTGEVKEIGIRASVIRTVEGAEVIVPNSELITQDVINWTRSGTLRRLEVPVGVAYGSDPARVIGLLTDVALAHPLVRGNPKPFALFLGFGESSLNFTVRAWTDSLDWPMVRSDVALAIHAAFKESGIEIPFPQRELRLRSGDVKRLNDLQGESTGA